MRKGAEWQQQKDYCVVPLKKLVDTRAAGEGEKDRYSQGLMEHLKTGFKDIKYLEVNIDLCFCRSMWKAI